MAFGACSTSCGISDFRMLTLVAANSSRDWPGFCLAPAVMMTTEESLTTEMSAPPVTRPDGVNWVPCERSRTSASTFLASRS